MSPTAQFFVMQTALIAVVLVLHTYMGLHIIRRGIIFCDLVLDQLAAFGAVVGIGLGVRYGTPGSYLASSLAVTLGAVLLAVVKPKRREIPQEAVIGIMYGLALVGSLLVADKLASGGTFVAKTLVGSMLWVSWPLVGVTAGVYALLMLFHYRYRRLMICLTEGSVSGRSGAWWDFLFFLSQGVITILIVPVAGVLLAYGFLMIPAAIGLLFTRDWRAGLLVGWVSGLAACFLGLFCSYTFGLSYGPTLLLAMGVFFVGALVLRAVLPGQEAAT